MSDDRKTPTRKIDEQGPPKEAPRREDELKRPTKTTRE
jgi:hypothetical protein